jgi:hypothetical protein
MKYMHLNIIYTQNSLKKIVITTGKMIICDGPLTVTNTKKTITNIMAVVFRHKKKKSVADTIR